MTRKEYRTLLDNQAHLAQKILEKAMISLLEKDFSEIPAERLAAIISVAKLLQNDCTIEENVVSEVVLNNEIF